MKIIVSLMCLLSPALFAADDVKDDPLVLAGSVHVIFNRSCNDCHGSHLPKPEGKFGFVLDLKRIGDSLDYVVRGQPDKSELYRSVKLDEMPPHDHPKTPPLSTTEKDLVRRWILAGAPSALPATLPVLPVPSATELALPKAAGLPIKELAKQTSISLNEKDVPAGDVFALITKLSGIRIEYVKPEREPKLSIVLKHGTVFEALDYLVLCGNFSLTYTATGAKVDMNPPRVGDGEKKK